MKPFIGIDITENKNNEEINGKEFVVQTASAVLLEAYNKASEEIDGFCKKVIMPLPVRIVYGALGFVAMVVTAGFVKAIVKNDDISFIDAYRNAPVMFWIGIAAWILFWVISVFYNRKGKAMAKSDEFNHAQTKTLSIINSIYAELDVPAQAPFVDILSFQYKIKDGKLKPKNKEGKTVPFINIAFKIHNDGQRLYLTETENKYAFELSALKGIKVIKEKGFIQNWNKEIPFDDPAYEQYKITNNDHGIYFKKYCILELEHNGEIWEIYFPDYDLPIVEQATGLKAE